MNRIAPDQPSPFRGVIFDMDGVLVDSEPFICEAACTMFQERHNTVVQPADFVPFIGTGERHYLGGVAERYGLTLNLPDDKQRLYEIYLQIIPGRLQPLPHVLDLLGALRQAGRRLAVGTSADDIKMRGNLAAIGLAADAFDALVTGSEVEHKKPAPDLFLLAAERLGLPPSECLVIEDAPEGVRAAVAAGCSCLGLTSSFCSERLWEAGASWVVGSLGDLPADLSPRLASPTAV